MWPQIIFGWVYLKLFCEKENIVLNSKACSAKDLGEALASFNVGLRKLKECWILQEGILPCGKSCVKSRNLSVELEKPDCNIFRKPEFQRSNNSPEDSLLKQAKARGGG